jgi:hypothetical protein
MLLALAAAVAVAIPAPQPVEPCFFNGKWIKRVVKRHRSQLAQCFVHEFEYGWYRTDPVDLQVTLQFQVATDGHVEWSDTTGEAGPVIKACLDKQVRTWTFWTGTSDAARINYGLHFVLSSY